MAPFNGNVPGYVAYAKDADLLFTLAAVDQLGGTYKNIMYDQKDSANAPILQQTAVSVGRDVAYGIAVDRTGQNVFVTDAHKILRFVASASTFVPGTPISGSNTGLNFPLALTVGAP